MMYTNCNNDAFNLLVQERNITVSEKEQEIDNLRRKYENSQRELRRARNELSNTKQRSITKCSISIKYHKKQII